MYCTRGDRVAIWLLGLVISARLLVVITQLVEEIGVNLGQTHRVNWS
jgi:hypothetical protein